MATLGLGPQPQGARCIRPLGHMGRQDELERLRQLRAYRRKWPEPRYPQALTTPKRCDMQPQRA